MRTRTVLAAASSALLLVAAAPSLGPPDQTFEVTTTADSNDANPGDGDCADADGECSLRAAVQEANASGGTTDIELLEDATHVLDLGEDIDVTASVRVLGDDSAVDATDNDDRHFDVAGNAALELDGVELFGGQPADGENGGAVRVADDGDLRVLDSFLHDNTVTGDGASGGAIAIDDAELLVQDSTIADNAATRAGGGIEVAGGDAVVSDSQLRANDTGTMPGNGGGLHLGGDGDVDVIDSDVADNIAQEGGGLWVSAVGTMTVFNSDISGNTANGTALGRGGGGLFNQGGLLVVLGSEVNDNTAPNGAGSGGGILATGTTRVAHTTIEGNSANRAGGGVEATTLSGAPRGTTSLRHVELNDNTTGPMPGNGGGLHVTATNDVDVDKSEVTGNTAASEGGGLWNNAGSTMTVTDTELTGNRANGEAADNGGGALFNNGGELVVSDSEVADNFATEGSGSGGGLLNDDGEVRISDTEFEDNVSNRAGGAIEANIGSTVLDRVELTDNRTGDAPGNGGGVHLTGAGTVEISDSTVTDNRADAEGGGLWNSSTGTMTATDTEVCDNRAPLGPNVFNDGGTMTVNGDTIPEGDNDLEFCDERDRDRNERDDDRDDRDRDRDDRDDDRDELDDRDRDRNERDDDRNEFDERDDRDEFDDRDRDRDERDDDRDEFDERDDRDDRDEWGRGDR